jgi:hypothetical protein
MHLWTNLWGGIGKRMVAQASPGQKHKTLCKKYIRTKKGGDVAPVVEYVPSTCKALSLNPSTTKVITIIDGAFQK